MRRIKLFEDYTEKREMSLPVTADVKGLRSIVDKAKKELDVELEYNIPYPDASDDKGRHSAVKEKWWAGINVIVDGGVAGQVKFVKEPSGNWKYYNVKMHSDRRNSEEEKKLIKYFSGTA